MGFGIKDIDKLKKLPYVVCNKTFGSAYVIDYVYKTYNNLGSSGTFDELFKTGREHGNPKQIGHT